MATNTNNNQKADVSRAPGTNKYMGKHGAGMRHKKWHHACTEKLNKKRNNSTTMQINFTTQKYQELTIIEKPHFQQNQLLWLLLLIWMFRNKKKADHIFCYIDKLIIRTTSTPKDTKKTL